MARIPANNENLCSDLATKPVTQWLIEAAKTHKSLSYGAAKERLEKEVGFDTIFSAKMGKPCGELMDKILKYDPDAPLLNVLMVSAKGDPGQGVDPYLAKRFKNDALKNPKNRKKPIWNKAVYEATSEVYDYRDKWDTIYKNVYGEKLPLPSPRGSEKDGNKGGRGGGEGLNHKALRLWVEANPHKINPAFRGFRAVTEFELESADRVDVVYFGGRRAIAVEVKSKDSDYADLRRGVFQCIKYRAVMEAMDARKNPRVKAILVTQEKLPGDLKSIAAKNRIRHYQAPKNIKMAG